MTLDPDQRLMIPTERSPKETQQSEAFVLSRGPTKDGYPMEKYPQEKNTCCDNPEDVSDLMALVELELHVPEESHRKKPSTFLVPYLPGTSAEGAKEAEDRCIVSLEVLASLSPHGTNKAAWAMDEEELLESSISRIPTKHLDWIDKRCSTELNTASLADVPADVETNTFTAPDQSENGMESVLSITSESNNQPHVVTSFDIPKDVNQSKRVIKGNQRMERKSASDNQKQKKHGGIYSLLLKKGAVPSNVSACQEKSTHARRPICVAKDINQPFHESSGISAPSRIRSIGLAEPTNEAMESKTSPQDFKIQHGGIYTLLRRKSKTEAVNK